MFGAVDGLVTNASLIAGVGGGGASPHAVVLTGVAALVAGAFSMGTGEYVSVTNQNEPCRLVPGNAVLYVGFLWAPPGAGADLRGLCGAPRGPSGPLGGTWNQLRDTRACLP